MKLTCRMPNEQIQGSPSLRTLHSFAKTIVNNCTQSLLAISLNMWKAWHMDKLYPGNAQSWTVISLWDSSYKQREAHLNIFLHRCPKREIKLPIPLSYIQPNSNTHILNSQTNFFNFSKNLNLSIIELLKLYQSSSSKTITGNDSYSCQTFFGAAMSLYATISTKVESWGKRHPIQNPGWQDW